MFSVPNSSRVEPPERRRLLYPLTLSQLNANHPAAARLLVPEWPLLLLYEHSAADGRGHWESYAPNYSPPNHKR